MGPPVGVETEGVPLVDHRRLVLTKDPRKKYRRSTWSWKKAPSEGQAWAFDGKHIIGGPVQFVPGPDVEVKIPIAQSGTVGAIIIKAGDRAEDTQIYPVSWPVVAGDIVHFKVT